MLNYRNKTLEEFNLSAAQLIMRHMLKSTLPARAPLLRPQGSDEVKCILKKGKDNQKQHYDKHRGKELPSLQPGDTVRMQMDKWIPAIVSYKYKTPRSYVVETTYGRKYSRNHHHAHVSQAPEIMPPVPPETDYGTNTDNSSTSNGCKIYSN